MATQKKSTIVRYSVPGTQPPLYVAGSFSNPEWTPLPMQYTVNDDGEYLFTKEVEAEEGKEYQYKFRVGEGDWWLLNEDEPTGEHSPYDATLKDITFLYLLILPMQLLTMLVIATTSSKPQFT